MSALLYFCTFIVGIAAGTLGAMVGGGGLITVPFLIFLGFSPAEAVANTKVGACGSSSSAVRKYAKEKVIHFGYAIPLTVLTIFGSAIGASFMIKADQQMVQTILAICILTLLPLILRSNTLGVLAVEPGKLRLAIGFFVYFLIQIYGGFLGAGGGVLGLYALMFFFGLPIIHAAGTGALPWVAMSITSASIYWFNGLVDWFAAGVLFAGMIIGGQIGASMAIKKGNQWVRNVFALVVVLSAIKLLAT